VHSEDELTTLISVTDVNFASTPSLKRAEATKQHCWFSFVVVDTHLQNAHPNPQNSGPPYTLKRESSSTALHMGGCECQACLYGFSGCDDEAVGWCAVVDAGTVSRTQFFRGGGELRVCV
jgi:hypothetical protein